MRARATALATIAATALYAPPHPAAAKASATKRMPAPALLARLRHGEPVVFKSLTVTGRLAFGSLDTVRAPFKCIECRFLDRVDASDVIFGRIVDLSGSEFKRGASFQGATFQGPALFANVPRPAAFHGPATFRLAVFEDLAAFDHATIAGRTDFSRSRFESQASFVGTTFRRNVAFTAAVLSGAALFNKAIFDRHADFERTLFGPTDFRDATFAALAVPDFRDATFRGPANFSIAHFGLGASFVGAQFTKSAAFVATGFCGAGPNLAAYFDGVTAGGDLDFSYASFTMAGPGPCLICLSPPPSPEHRCPTPHRTRTEEEKEPPQVASFDDLVSRGTVTLSTASFAPGHPVSMNKIKVKDLRMPIAQTARVDEGGEPARTKPQRRQVLRVIEAGAKARGDLVTANDATYELHVLSSRGYSRGRRLVDLVFYRWIAGYLVRPLRPLVALVIIAIVVSLVRTVLACARPRSEGDRRRLRFLPSPRSVFHGLDRFLHEFFDALGRGGPRRGSDSDERALAPRLEAVVYRLLLACAIIGLANSNPTLRQLVDALV
jgi:uncharacterized protein YjbI with pentapeptide repeats